MYAGRYSHVNIQRVPPHAVLCIRSRFMYSHIRCFRRVRLRSTYYAFATAKATTHARMDNTQSVVQVVLAAAQQTAHHAEHCRDRKLRAPAQRDVSDAAALFRAQARGQRLPRIHARTSVLGGNKLQPASCKLPQGSLHKRTRARKGRDTYFAYACTYITWHRLCILCHTTTLARARTASAPYASEHAQNLRTRHSLPPGQGRGSAP